MIVLPGAKASITGFQAETNANNMMVYKPAGQLIDQTL